MKLYSKILALSFCFILSSSCAKSPDRFSENSADKDYVVEWTPVVLSVIACDKDGNDLLGPETKGITITFRGTEYELFLQKYQMLDDFGNLHRYRLVFGEIDGAEDMDEDLVLTWNDGEKYTIHYHCSEHVGGAYPHCTRLWMLNGIPCELPILIIK